VSIPIPQIDIPRFRFGDKQQGGVGQGDGEARRPARPGDEKQAGGSGQGGQRRRRPRLEVDVTLDELARSWARSWSCPTSRTRARASISNAHDRYSGIRRVGPRVLRHFKRTYREALKRMIASGTFDPDKPVVVPIPTTSATAPGRRSPSPSPTPSSST
jgi:uncharacterized sporulation protein YeaH/YhbH (DUF444 family)